MLRNHFIYALGIGAASFLFFRGMVWALDAFLSLLSSFAAWYRVFGMRYADELACLTQ